MKTIELLHIEMPSASLTKGSARKLGYIKELSGSLTYVAVTVK